MGIKKTVGYTAVILTAASFLRYNGRLDEAKLPKRPDGNATAEATDTGAATLPPESITKSPSVPTESPHTETNNIKAKEVQTENNSETNPADTTPTPSASETTESSTNEAVDDKYVIPPHVIGKGAKAVGEGLELAADGANEVVISFVPDQDKDLVSQGLDELYDTTKDNYFQGWRNAVGNSIGLAQFLNERISGKKKWFSSSTNEAAPIQSAESSVQITNNELKKMLNRYNRLNHIPCLKLNEGKWNDDPDLFISRLTAKDIEAKAAACNCTPQGIIRFQNAPYVLLLSQNNSDSSPEKIDTAVILDLDTSDGKSTKDALTAIQDYNYLDYLHEISVSQFRGEEEDLLDNGFDDETDLSSLTKGHLSVAGFYKYLRSDGAYEYTTFFKDNATGNYYKFDCFYLNADLSNKDVAAKITREDLTLADSIISSIRNVSLKEELKKPISHIPYLIQCDDGSYIQSSSTIISSDWADTIQNLTKNQHPGCVTIALAKPRNTEKIFAVTALREGGKIKLDILEVE